MLGFFNGDLVGLRMADHEAVANIGQLASLPLHTIAKHRLCNRDIEESFHTGLLRAIRGSHLHISLSANLRIIVGLTTSVRPVGAAEPTRRRFLRGAKLPVLWRLRAERARGDYGFRSAECGMTECGGAGRLRISDCGLASSYLLPFLLSYPLTFGALSSVPFVTLW